MLLAKPIFSLYELHLSYLRCRQVVGWLSHLIHCFTNEQVGSAEDFVLFRQFMQFYYNKFNSCTLCNIHVDLDYQVRIKIIGNLAFLRLTQFLILSLAMLTSGHDGPLAKISSKHQTLGLHDNLLSRFVHNYLEIVHLFANWLEVFYYLEMDCNLFLQ